MPCQVVTENPILHSPFFGRHPYFCGDEGLRAYGL